MSKPKPQANAAPALAAPQAQYNAAVTTQPAYAVSYTNHQNRRHVVVPVVMMVPGVHCGSAGPVLHTAEQLARHPGAWNGIPVTIGHPVEQGACVSANRPDIIDATIVGRVYNSQYDAEANKLRAEVWLDESAVLSREPSLIAHLVNGLPMDVSIGAFTDDTAADGIYEGVAYSAISSNYRPDHLALLPHDQGACSWNDGCGLRANSLTYNLTQQGGEPMEKQLWLAFQALGLTLTPRAAPVSFQANQQGYLELIEQLQRKLDAMDSEAQYHYLEELFDDGTCVYRVSPRDGRPSQYYRRGYTTDATGAVVFADALTLVRRQVEYVDVTGDSAVTANATPAMARTRSPNGGTTQMSTNNKTPCPALEAVMALARFEEADRTWLTELPLTALERLLAVYGEEAPAVETPAEGEAAPEPVEEPTTEEAPAVEEGEEAPAVETPAEGAAEAPQANAPMTLAAYVAAAPEHLQPQLNAGLELYDAHRTSLIERVTGITTVYTAEELGALTTAELEKLAKAVKAPADYSLRSGGTIKTNSGNVLLPPGVKKQD